METKSPYDTDITDTSFNAFTPGEMYAIRRHVVNSDPGCSGVIFAIVLVLMGVASSVGAIHWMVWVDDRLTTIETQLKVAPPSYWSKFEKSK